MPCTSYRSSHSAANVALMLTAKDQHRLVLSTDKQERNGDENNFVGKDGDGMELKTVRNGNKIHENGW